MALLSHVPQDDLPSNSTLEFNNIDYFFHQLFYLFFTLNCVLFKIVSMNKSILINFHSISL